MGASELKIDVGGLDRLDRIITALGEEIAALPGDFKRDLREVADALSAEASARVLLEPTHGMKHTGLRMEIARGVGVTETADGVVITTSMPKRDETDIPSGMDDPATGWRHPVFGHRDRWVTQHGAFSWFTSTMDQAEELATAKLTQTLQDAADHIAS